MLNWHGTSSTFFQFMSSWTNPPLDPDESGTIRPMAVSNLKVDWRHVACEDTKSNLLLGIFHNHIYCEVQQVSYGFVFSLDIFRS